MELKQKIQDVYNINVKNLKFVPVGEFASSYIVTTEEKGKYFLKLYFPSRLKNQENHKLDFSLEVVHQLYHAQGIKHISYPIKTVKGNLKSQFQEAEMVLWNYIEGKITSEKKSKTTIFLNKISALLAQIHDSTEYLKFQDKFLFNLDLSFKDDLLLCLREIAACTKSTDKTFLRLKNLITPLMNDILQSLTYLEEITQNLKNESPQDYVVCHNDPIRHNILLNKQDEIFLVDWDSAYFAPFEKDIWFYLNQKNFPSFKQKYKEIRESANLNEEIVVYLFYERVLADLTDWVYRILFEESDPMQVKSDFQGLDEDVIPFLPNMIKVEKDLRQRAKEW
ncbi:MAG: Stress response kinase A [Candidatus Heimdallarchaeota archaeon AB_125]|nr:MAG: Stress response kinase A [Candidatus Heimdallarchaeota archaeon AB_125]